MHLPIPLKLSVIFSDCPEEYADLEILGISDPKKIEPGDCVCCFDLYELSKLLSDPAAIEMACIIGPVLDEWTHRIPYIPVKRPRLVLQKILQVVSQLKEKKISLSPKVHPSAIVSPLASIHSSVCIGPYCVIEDRVVLNEGVIIGSHCVIESFCDVSKDAQIDHHVVLKKGCKIGERTVIQNHTTIGPDGFGFEREGSGWVKIPHLASVIIENDCYIGSHVAIAAGALNPTRISSHVIIDNHVQIAHHVHIGSGTAIAGCVGIAGSTTIGENCLIGGGVKIAGHLKIVDRVHITGMTMVTKSLLKSGIYSSGMPVDTNELWKKKIITLNKLAKKETQKNTRETQEDAIDI